MLQAKHNNEQSSDSRTGKKTTTSSETQWKIAMPVSES